MYITILPFVADHVSVDQPVLAYLGPAGTFTEQALHSQTDLLDYTLTPTTVSYTHLTLPTILLV